ncbi:uncharacterized protein LOC144173133 [Haemaphysalis longicornis]
MGKVDTDLRHPSATNEQERNRERPSTCGEDYKLILEPPESSAVIQHSAVLATTLFNNARLRNVTNVGDATFSFDVSTFGLEALPQLDSWNRYSSHNKYYQVLPEVLRSIFFPLCSSLMCCAFVLFPIAERAMQVKHLHMITGVSPLLYWLTNFVFDFSFYLGAALFVLPPVVYFQYDVLTSSDIKLIFALNCLHGYAALPVIYVFSFMFNNPGVGFSTLAVWTFIISAIGCFASVFVDHYSHGESSPHLVIAIRMLLQALRMVPSTSYSRGMIKVLQLAHENAVCWKGGTELEASCRGEANQHRLSLMQCCRFDKFSSPEDTKPPDPLSLAAIQPQGRPSAAAKAWHAFQPCCPTSSVGPRSHHERRTQGQPSPSENVAVYIYDKLRLLAGCDFAWASPVAKRYVIDGLADPILAAALAVQPPELSPQAFVRSGKLASPLSLVDEEILSERPGAYTQLNYRANKKSNADHSAHSQSASKGTPEHSPDILTLCSIDSTKRSYCYFADITTPRTSTQDSVRRGSTKECFNYSKVPSEGHVPFTVTCDSNNHTQRLSPLRKHEEMVAMDTLSNSSAGVSEASGHERAIVSALSDLKSGDADQHAIDPLDMHSYSALSEVLSLSFEGALMFGVLLFVEWYIPRFKMCMSMLEPSAYLQGVQVPTSTQAAPHSLPRPMKGDVEDTDVARENEIVAGLVAGRLVPDTAHPYLLVNRLFKSYGYINSNPVLQGLSFTVQKGECFGLLGVNGVGKTTTFRILTGELLPHEGDAYITGVSLVQTPRQFRRYIGYCPEKDGVLDVLTGKETVLLFGRLRGLAMTPEYTNVLLDIFNLTEIANQLVRTYSSGNRRTLSLCIAVLGVPRLLLLDEPYVGIGSSARKRIINFISAIQKATEASIVLSSHSMADVEFLCNRIAILSDGQLQCIGSLANLKEKFGKGYTIIVKTYPYRKQDDDYLRDVAEAIVRAFRRAELMQIYEGQLEFHMSRVYLLWSDMFSRMANIKKRYKLQDFFITDTSLEQIFLSVARKEASSADTAAAKANARDAGSPPVALGI